jgi:hypothetical protein
LKIFTDEEDLRTLLDVLAQALSRFEAEALACSLIATTASPRCTRAAADLSLLMQYTQGCLRRPSIADIVSWGICSKAALRPRC